MLVVLIVSILVITLFEEAYHGNNHPLLEQLTTLINEFRTRRGSDTEILDRPDVPIETMANRTDEEEDIYEAQEVDYSKYD